MRNPLRLSFSSLFLVLLAGCGGGEGLLLPGDGEPAAIVVLRGSGQSGPVGARLAEPLVVEVTDSRGRVVEGARVAFEFGSAAPGAAAVPDTGITNGDGIADARLVLGTTIGQQTGQARLVLGEGREPIQAPFSAMALPENANTMAPVAGQDQIGHVGLPLDDRLVVEVTDGFGNPVAGVPISWEAVGGGSVSEALVATDEDGRSRVDRILGPIVGQQTTLASSEGLAGSPVTFVHTALSGDASRLVVVSGNDQTAEAGTTLPAELVVQLIDAEGNGVPETAVSWVVAIGGGTAAPAISTTDADGRASTRWTLGATLGQQRIDAVVSGVGFASFQATATAGAPASLFIRTQPSASARNGVRLDRQPVIQLRDAQGNDVAAAGVQVTAQLDGGGELEGTIRRSTDASGRATFDDLAISGALGTRTLTFTAAGYAQVTSSEIEVVTILTTTTITGDSPDPSVSSSTFTVQVRVTSEGPTPTGSVTVTVSGGPARCTATLSGGVGSCSLSLGLVGNRTLTATYSGAPGLSPSSDTESHTVTPSQPSNEAPDADFNWHCEGLTCFFTDGSEDDDGTITRRNWDFGDGSSVQNQLNPSHTYAQPGDYRVVLTVTDNGGLSDEAHDTVDPEAPPPENQAPTAEFTWQCNDLECDFEDESNDNDGDIEDYDWSFGDGGTSDDDDPEHTYSSGNTYQVTLTVTDDDGGRGSVTHSVTVAGNQAPTASFTQSCAGLTCSFNSGGSSDPDGTIVSRRWSFGDDDESSEANPSHTYEAGGTYNVTLRVEDDDEATDEEIHQVTVTAPNEPPTAVDDAATTEAGASVTINVLANDDDPEGAPLTTTSVGDPPNGSTVNNGDGTVTYTPDPGFSGADDVFTYVVSDGSLSDEATVTVTVNAAVPPTEPGSLGFRTQPPERTESGDRLNPEPEIELRDAADNALEVAGVLVRAVIASGAGILHGTTSRETDGDGRAEFEELRISGGEGARVTLAFSAPGFGSVDSGSILIEEEEDDD